MTFDLKQYSHDRYSHGRKDGVTLTVRIIKSKLEELRSRFLENTAEENSDAKDQIKMLQEIENAVKTKEALKQAEEESAKNEAVKKEKERKREEEEESLEMLILEENFKNFQKFCTDNGIEIELKTHAQEAIDKILKQGRGGDHSNQDRNRSQ